MIIAREADEGLRFDVFLAKEAGLSRQTAQTLIERGLARLNGLVKPKRTRLACGDALEYETPLTPKVSGVEPQNIPLDIIFEDDYFCVVNKPANMPTHPAPGWTFGTLANALAFHVKNLSQVDEARPGIVHRLDKDTTGLLLAAKNNFAHIALAKQIENRQAKRRYLTILNGVLKNALEIKAPIGRSPYNRKKMAVVANGRYALTSMRPLIREKNFTLAEARLHTGRTHQIRVHAAHINRPVLGDIVYGGGANGETSPFLHAFALEVFHPKNERIMRFFAPPSPRFIEKAQNIFGAEILEEIYEEIYESV